MSNYKSFTDDEEKMIDFFILTKQEFLKSYSYLTELEYDLTKQEVNTNVWANSHKRTFRYTLEPYN